MARWWYFQIRIVLRYGTSFNTNRNFRKVNRKVQEEPQAEAAAKPRLNAESGADK